MLSAASAIGQAVRQASATTKVGLMSSVPHVHAAEGRDWHALLRALAAGLPPVDRIHLPGYQEQAPGAYLAGLNRVALLNRAFLPRETEVYPELENFPYSLFSKSRRFTRFQLLSALVLNLAGITIDLYDLNGNGIVWEDGYQDMLRDVKPFLNRLTALGVFAGERRGVHVLCSPDSSYTLHTTRGASMEELYPRETFFAQLLPALGIPAAYCLSPDLSGQVVAASGQVLRNWSAETLNRLFARNFFILDGDALWALLDMGLGHLAGVESARWLTQGQRGLRLRAGRGRARLRRTDRRARLGHDLLLGRAGRALPARHACGGVYRILRLLPPPRRARADGGGRTGDDLSFRSFRHGGAAHAAWPRAAGNSAGRAGRGRL